VTTYTCTGRYVDLSESNVVQLEKFYVYFMKGWSLRMYSSRKNLVDVCFHIMDYCLFYRDMSEPVALALVLSSIASPRIGGEGLFFGFEVVSLASLAADNFKSCSDT